MKIRGSKGRRWAKGRKSFGICDRSGFSVPTHRLVKEPGTNIVVDRSWSDGKWNRVDHPLNFPADTSESISLRNPRPDVEDPSPEFLRDNDGALILGEDGLPIFI